MPDHRDRTKWFQDAQLMTRLNALQPVGLLLLRLALGIIFIWHGYPKLTHPNAMHGFFVQHGMPGYFVTVAGVLEVFGGGLIILAFLTRIAALLLTMEMAVAIWKVHSAGGYMAVHNYEFPWCWRPRVSHWQQSEPGGLQLITRCMNQAEGGRGQENRKASRSALPAHAAISMRNPNPFVSRPYGVTVTEFAAMRAGAGGSAIQRIKYARTPVPANNTRSSHTMRTSVGSRSKYSARPPQTPAIFLFVVERVRRFAAGAAYAGGGGAPATNLAPQL